MKSLDEHRKKLKEIADYAFSYGVQNSGIDFSKIENLEQINLDISKFFVQKVHEGFKIAQKLLIDEINIYQDEWSSLKEKIKQSRRDSDKKKENELLQIERVIEYRISTFSHIADGIAWQMIGGQIHIGRRLHIGERGLKSLNNNNLSHAISVADKINEDNDSFALISDLTGFVQIGDLLIKKDNYLGIMELKEGKVNEQIADFLEKIELEGKSINEIDLEQEHDKKTVKQIKRVHRQKERMERAIEVINSDEGIDPISGSHMKVSTPKVNTEYYHDVLEDMQETLNGRNWDYNIVDGCLHIGMYKNESRIMADGVIEAIVAKETDNFLIIDWMSITENLSEPIFLKPFPTDFIIDILTGEIKVIMALNFDKMIEFFNQLGLETKWLTEKETMKHKQNKIREGFLEVNKRGISIKVDGNDVIIYGGIISKIFYDTIRPSSIAVSFLTS